MICIVINDLPVTITAELLPVVPNPKPLVTEQIAAEDSAPFEYGTVGVSLSLVKDGVAKPAPLQSVVYASEIFPLVLETLQTIINDLAGTIKAEVQVPGPGGVHILQTQNIPSASSYTFALGRIGVDLVVIYQGKSVAFRLEGGKQVKYASELFPSAGSS